jgi:O-antigen/teichoic acid export membrane protein
MLGNSKHSPGSLSSNTFYMTVGLTTRAVLQGIIFFVIAQVLGVKGYGAFAATVAIASAFGGLIGFGTQTLLVKNIAHDLKNFNESWRNTITSLLISIPLIFSAYLFTTWLVLPPIIPLFVIITIGLAELVFWPVILCTISVYNGSERLGKAAKLLVLPTAIRLMAIFILLLSVSHLSANECLLVWSFLYAITHLISAGYSLYSIRNDYGMSFKFSNKQAFVSELWKGLPFAFNNVSLRLHADVDKTMLSRLVSLETSGIYSAAYRVVDMFTLPIHAMIQSAYPRFFRAGIEKATLGTFSYARKIFLIPLAYALLVGISIFLCADLITLLLGDEYSETVNVLKLLAFLPLTSVARLFIQTSLLTGGNQLSAVVLSMCGAVVNIILNLWLIPHISWKGAVFATYISEGFMTFGMLGIIVFAKFKK